MTSGSTSNWAVLFTILQVLKKKRIECSQHGNRILLGDEMTAGDCMAFNIHAPALPDRGGIGGIDMIVIARRYAFVAPDHERRAGDPAAGREIYLICRKIASGAGAIVVAGGVDMLGR